MTEDGLGRGAQATTLRFLVLGAVEVWCDSVLVPIAQGKLRSLLACLLLRANQPVPVETLAGWLWETDPPRDARTTLRGYVMRLRRALESGGLAERLERADAGYLIRVQEGELDLHEFHTLTRRARAAVGAAEAAELWHRAVWLWRGDPLSNVSAGRLIDEVVPVFWEQYTEAQEKRIDADLALGRYAALIGELRGLVRDHPLRERFWAQLIRAQAQAGRQAEALECYRTVHALVRDELGVEPSAELQDLHRSVLAGEVVQPVAADMAVPVPAQLPAEVFGFCGRTGLLSTLDGLFQECSSASGRTPIVVLSGAAGTGKTALAVHWANRVRDHFPDGQLYVDLGGYGPGDPVDAAQALDWLLRSLGASAPPDVCERSALLRSMLDRKRVLMVLDNAHSAEQVRPLLPGAGACLVVVTSRDALPGLIAREGARRIDVGLLSAEESLELLRALLGTRIDEDPDAARELVRSCARLPLALRVAAESIADRSDEELATAVSGLDDSCWKDVGDESATVHTVFSWSLRHLQPRDRHMFRMLGHFPGREFDQYSLAAAAGTDLATAAASLRTLARANLIQRGGKDRFHLHDLLRGFAIGLAKRADDAAENRDVLRRLFGYYLYTVSVAMDETTPLERRYRPTIAPPRTSSPVFLGAEAALRWLDSERPTLLALADIAAHQGEHRELTTLSRLLFRYLDRAGYYDEGVTLFRRALTAARMLGDVAAEAAELTDLGVAFVRQGQVAAATEMLEQALTALRTVDDALAESRVLNALGLVHSWTGHYRDALVCELNALELAEKAADQYGRCRTHMNLAVTYQRLGEHDAAQLHGESALRLAMQENDRSISSRVLNNLGFVAMEQHHDNEALRYFERALALSEQIGDRAVEGYVVSNIGVILARRGDAAAAAEHQLRARELAGRTGDDALELEALNALGELARLAGDLVAEDVHRGAALTVAYRIGNQYWQARTHAALARVHAALGGHAVAEQHRLRSEGLCDLLGLSWEELDQALSADGLS